MESGLELTTPMLGFKRRRRRSEESLMEPPTSNIIHHSLFGATNNDDADIITSTSSPIKRNQPTPSPLLFSPDIPQKRLDFPPETMDCIKAGMKWDLRSALPSSRTTHPHPHPPNKSKSKSKASNPPRKHRGSASKQAVPHLQKKSGDRLRKQPLEPGREKLKQAIASTSRSKDENADEGEENETPIPMPMPAPHGDYNSFLSQTNNADQIYDVATDKTYLLFTARNYRSGGFGGVGAGDGDEGGSADCQLLQPAPLNIDRVSAFDLARPRQYVSFYAHGDMRGVVEDGIVRLAERGERRREEWREGAWWRDGGGGGL